MDIISKVCPESGNLIGASCSGSSRCLSRATDVELSMWDKGRPLVAKETWDDVQAVPEWLVL